MKRSNLGVIALLVVLSAMLIGGGYFVHDLTFSGRPLPEHFYVAMTLGIVFSLAVGIGLMGLVFYSSRKGYDEPPSFRE
jgi:hypothetical protein